MADQGTAANHVVRLIPSVALPPALRPTGRHLTRNTRDASTAAVRSVASPTPQCERSQSMLAGSSGPSWRMWPGTGSSACRSNGQSRRPARGHDCRLVVALALRAEQPRQGAGAHQAQLGRAIRRMQQRVHPVLFLASAVHKSPRDNSCSAPPPWRTAPPPPPALSRPGRAAASPWSAASADPARHSPGASRQGDRRRTGRPQFRGPAAWPGWRRSSSRGGDTPAWCSDSSAGHAPPPARRAPHADTPR